MKKIVYLILVLVSLLSACSADPDAAKRYKQEAPLEVEILTPESFSPNHSETIRARLTQNGRVVENPNFVHFEIWKQDGSVRYPMEEANEDGHGIYSLRKSFDHEGLYFIKVHAGNKGSIIMPQKQFIVGQLSDSDLQFLKKGAPFQTGGHENHH